jgi:hypothetical protein
MNGHFKEEDELKIPKAANDNVDSRGILRVL